MLVLAAQTGLRISELTGLTCADMHLGVGAYVHCRRQRPQGTRTPLTPLTVRVLRVWLAERARRTRPIRCSRPSPAGGSATTPSNTGSPVTSSPPARACPSLRAKRVTMHTLRHSAAMRLLESGTDITVIALWLGHFSGVLILSGCVRPSAELRG